MHAEAAGFVLAAVDAIGDPDRLGAVFATLDGTIYGAGDIDTEFTIQSISKPFAYALALADRGFDAVLAKVGVEPSGEAFNELSLEEESKRPDNAMINTGALATHQLLVGPYAGRQERIDRVVSLMSTLADRRLEIDHATFEKPLG